MLPVMTYLLKIDRAKWEEFKQAVAEEGHTARWMLEELIDTYLKKRRARKPKVTDRKD